MNRNTKTAREIGRLTNRTAQNINKRLLANGLMYASADGYHLTEAGEPYGIEKVKITRNNYMFCNIEWTRAVLNIIFTEEEQRENARWLAMQKVRL